MTLLQAKMSALDHRTALKSCPTMTTYRPFGRQRHSTPRPGAGGKRTSRQAGHRMQTRMAVATEFPLPRLDRFEWDQMKLADLTGTACTRSFNAELQLAFISKRFSTSSPQSDSHVACPTWCAWLLCAEHSPHAVLHACGPLCQHSKS